MLGRATKAGITTAVTLAALGGVVGSPAHASPVDPRSHTPHPRNSVSVHPKTTDGIKKSIVEVCAFEADTPFHLVVDDPNIYSQGKITGCTDPAPDECHMIVDLERQTYLEDGSIYWADIARKDAGWGSCAGQVGKLVTVKFGCKYEYPPDFQYQTLVTLTAINSEGGSDAEFAASPIFETTCY
jgi:hypothetical protein